MTSVAESPKLSSSPSRAGTNKSPSASSSSPAAGVSGSGTNAGAAAGSTSSGRFLTHQGSSGSLTSGFGGARSTRDRDITSLVPSATECHYSACFCEENVWKVCEHVNVTNQNELSKCYVVFVSNRKQVVPLWRQRAGRDEDKLVIWDYHAIFVYKPDERCLVFDLDSDLPFPTFFHKYVTETFRTDAILNPEYHRLFRVIPASQFLSTFASDRRHMKKSDGTWMKAPPPYAPICTPQSSHNLDQFISMEADVGIGEVLSLADFVKRFYRN